jgi:hypothetical protein
LTQLACACWRGDRVIPIRPGVSVAWTRLARPQNEIELKV